MNSKLKTQNPDFTQSVQSIIVEQTHNGERIVAFLIDAMEGHLPDFQPCHKLQAARLLQKYSGIDIAASDSAPLPDATRRERRDTRRADRRIQSELAQVVQEETDNGRAIVTFLVQAMEGELPDFKPCHRMSAAKELLHRGSQTDAPSPINNPSFPAKERHPVLDTGRESSGVGDGSEHLNHPASKTPSPSTGEGRDGGASPTHPAPEPDPEEQERQRLHQAARRQREEDIEFSLHGDLYYAVYPFPCTCEDRLHDCDGNELSEEKLQKAPTLTPMRYRYLRWNDTTEAYKARCRQYLTRRNARFPNNPIHFDQIHWEDP